MPPEIAIAPPRRSLDKTSAWALAITFIAALLLYLPWASVPFTTTKTFVLGAGALITLALFILARLARGNVIFPPMLLIGALWLPVIAYALSAAFSGISFSNALWGTALEQDTLGFMLIAAILGTLAALIVRRPEHYRSFLTAGGYAFGAIVVIQLLIVIVGQMNPDTVSPAFSLVGSFGDLGILLGLGVIGILITLRFLDLSRRTMRLLIGTGAAALLLLAVVNATIVWQLIALVSLGLFVEAIMRRGGRTADVDLEEAVVVNESPVETEEGNHSVVFPLGVLAVSLFFLLGGQLGGALAEALGVNVLNIRPSWQSTIMVGEKTYATRPIFGSGPGTFGVEWLKHRDPSLNSTIFWNVDFASGIGFIPTSFVTTGLIGAVAWIAFLLGFIVLGMRMLIVRTPSDGYIRYVAILSFVGALYLFAMAFFDLPGAIMLALAFTFAGIFVSTMRYAEGGAQWGIMFAKSPRIGFVIVFSLTILLLSSVVAAYTLVGHYVSAAELARSTNAFSRGEHDIAEQAAQRSLSFAPSSAAYQVQAGIANARLAAIAASTTMPRTQALTAYQNALSSGINAALAATNQYPMNYQNWLALGNLYAQAVPLGVSGAYDSAKTAYLRALELSPTNPQIHYILAQLNIANQDAKAAIADLKAAIALKQDYTAAIFLLSQLEVQQGNVRGALDSALSAAYFAPSDPNVLFQVGILYAAQNDFANAAAALSAAVDANPQFANARYFLAAVYARQGNLEDAREQVEAIAKMSSDNAAAVATQLTSLQNGRNPFPANFFAINPPEVTQ